MARKRRIVLRVNDESFVVRRQRAQHRLDELAGRTVAFGEYSKGIVTHRSLVSCRRPARVELRSGFARAESRKSITWRRRWRRSARPCAARAFVHAEAARGASAARSGQTVLRVRTHCRQPPVPGTPSHGDSMFEARICSTKPTWRRLHVAPP